MMELELDDIVEITPKPTRTRAERRRRDWSKAIRKRRIDRAVSYTPCYAHLHQYSKGKIHCSCEACSAKTNNKGWYGKRKNWKPSDQRRLDSMNYQLAENLTA